jgi:glutathione S-transferase
MSTARTLVCIHYSPWSEKARWALQLQGVEFVAEEYLPVFGLPRLRYRLGRWTGRVTVPILFDETGAHSDSFDIARRADVLRAQGRPPLIPDAEVDAIRAWNEVGEDMLAAGRVLATARVARDPQAQAESVPKLLRGVAGPFAQMGIQYLTRKYGLDAAPESVALERLTAGLAKLRAGLEGRTHLVVGGLTYADLLMAVALHFVAPPAKPYLRLGRATRAAFTTPALAEAYADLVAWRDRLYAEHRAAPQA